MTTDFEDFTNHKTPIEPFPESTDIKEWDKLKNFLRTFNNTEKKDISKVPVKDIFEYLKSINKPTVLLMTAGQYNQLYKATASFDLFNLVLFGCKHYNKLMGIHINGTDLHFHGLWYLFTNDINSMWTPYKITNDDNDLIYVGAGFKFINYKTDPYDTHGNNYYMFRWGHGLVNRENQSHQDTFLVCEGTIVYRMVDNHDTL